MKKALIILLLMVPSVSSLASTPTCHDTAGAPYCRYEGKIRSLYVNSGNLILFYFEAPIDVTIPQSKGYNVSDGSAGAIRIQENPDFADYFYSTALAAQASGRNVSIQMRGETGGYLKIDRIWLETP